MNVNTCGNCNRSYETESTNGKNIEATGWCQACQHKARAIERERSERAKAMGTEGDTATTFDERERQRDEDEGARNVAQATAYVDARSTYLATVVIPAVASVYQAGLRNGFTKRQAFDLARDWWQEEHLDDRYA